jgi:hypothetical protein
MATYRTGHISRIGICASAGSHHSHNLAGLLYSRPFRIAGNIRKRQVGSGFGLYVFVAINLDLGWARSQ